MDKIKRQVIKQLFQEQPELTAMEVMNGYIFWPYGENEHFMVDELQAIKMEVYNELNPVPVVEDLLPKEE